MGFTKVFAELTTSSIWEMPYPFRVVWMALMVNAGPDGVVPVSVDAVWRLANVTKNEAAEALEAFLGNDEKSRGKEYDGKRIELVDGGVKLLNYKKYREKQSPEAKRDYMRRYMAEKRAREKREKAVNFVKRSRGKLTNAEEWRDSYRLQAEAACATVAPQDFHEAVKSACAKFSECRREMAVSGRSKADCVRWTPEQARALHEQARLQISQMPPEKIAEKILGAAAAGYRKVNFASIFQ